MGSDGESDEEDEDDVQPFITRGNRCFPVQIPKQMTMTSSCKEIETDDDQDTQLDSIESTSDGSVDDIVSDDEDDEDPLNYFGKYTRLSHGEIVSHVDGKIVFSAFPLALPTSGYVAH